MASTSGIVYDLDYLQNQNWCQVLIQVGFVGTFAMDNSCSHWKLQ